MAASYEEEFVTEYRSAVTFRYAVAAVATALVLAATPSNAVGGEKTPLPFREIVKPGDIKEFDLGRPQVFGTAKAVRTAAGERPPKFEVERFEQEGFVEAVSIRVHGRWEQGAKGVISVFGFESRAGAEGEMAVERKRELEVNPSQGGAGKARLVGRRFLVPGVVGAVGVAVLPNRLAKRRGVRIGVAQALFIQGNCLFSVGIFRPASEEVIRPVVGGVEAIARRVRGTCP